MRLDDEGLHIRQSDINTWLNCPESLRRELLARQGDEPAPSFESDAALAGTVLHHVIEVELKDGIPMTLAEMKAMAAFLYTSQAHAFRMDPNCTFSEASFRDDNHAIQTLERLVTAWYQSPKRTKLVYETDHELLRLEQSFDSHLYDHPDGVPVWLTGTIDCVEPGQIDDWKSANQEYKQWERQRWAIQPTVYTFGAYTMGFLDKNPRGQILFEYTVFPKKGQDIRPDTIPVWRDANHWGWLAVQTMPLVSMVMQGYEQGFDREWIMNDQHSLCSPKWCPWWDGCKGQVVSADWQVTIRNR